MATTPDEYNIGIFHYGREHNTYGGPFQPCQLRPRDSHDG
jgi:hypothetical protein